MQKIMNVSVAVIRRDDGMVLFTERLPGKACPGEWEFPGGKIEAGESARQALDREIHEELGISIIEARPWLTMSYDYPHASVILNFYIVSRWKGQEIGKEGQTLSWQNISNMTISPLLAANEPVIRALQLPDIYAISCANEIGDEIFLQQLQKAISNGLQLLQIREKNRTARQLQRFIEQVFSITTAADVTTLINSALPKELQKQFSGIHLTSSHLMKLNHRPDFKLVAASCHNLQELDHANRLKLDFAVLSPISKTPSHPESTPMGFSKMSELVSNSAIPVYALGGMSFDQLQELQSHGAHGIAMMRNAWL